MIVEGKIQELPTDLPNIQLRVSQMRAYERANGRVLEDIGVFRQGPNNIIDIIWNEQFSPRSLITGLAYREEKIEYAEGMLIRRWKWMEPINSQVQLEALLELGAMFIKLQDHERQKTILSCLALAVVS
ncbi:hypothetical protein IFR05_016577 [Cadophora sp. M221]|nr:hypothetical protein IFR05_016577 [Cadophora sp. M221]